MRIALTGYAHPFGGGRVYGAERIAYYLALALKDMGHECVFFSVDGCNITDFKYVKISKPWADDVDLYWEAIKANGPFDFIHSFQASGCISSDMRKTPYCLEPFFSFHNFDENIVASSKLLNAINGGKSTVIYYGLPLEWYPNIEKISDNYLVWIGRIDMGKAPDIAIEVSKRMGKRLLLMGPAYHYPYFVEHIWPHIDNDKIIWLRGVDDKIKQRAFRKAQCLLSTNWAEYHEMFGIVNIEALASGCPIIGWGHKIHPSAINFEGGEIIENGKQGFLNEYDAYSDEQREQTIVKAIEYINHIGDINREDCYRLFLDRFTSRIRAEKCLKYYSIIQNRGNVFDITGEL